MLHHNQSMFHHPPCDGVRMYEHLAFSLRVSLIKCCIVLTCFMTSHGSSRTVKESCARDSETLSVLHFFLFLFLFVNFVFLFFSCVGWVPLCRFDNEKQTDTRKDRQTRASADEIFSD